MSEIKQTVLITGASSGIGRECARVFAGNGFDVVLTARSENRLRFVKRKLEQEYGIAAVVIPMDLSEPDAAVTLYKKLKKQNIAVDILINSAGFGDFAGFLDSDWSRQKNMVDLNVIALIQMTYVFGMEMRKRGHGRILNLSSASALSPGPYMSVYYATKAFVLSFSQAVAKELEGTGVTVTALCPGTVKTGFEKAAGMESSHMFAFIRPVSAIDAAKGAYRAVMGGKTVKYHGMPAKLINIGTRLATRGFIRVFARKINGVPL